MYTYTTFLPFARESLRCIIDHPFNSKGLASLSVRDQQRTSDDAIVMRLPCRQIHEKDRPTSSRWLRII